MKKILAFHILMAILLSLFSCQPAAHNSASIDESEESTLEATLPLRPEYLGRQELLDYLEQTEVLAIEESFPAPFDTVSFNKVIAYDYLGDDDAYRNVVSESGDRFIPVILRQKALDLRQIDFTIDFLTDNQSYGEYTAACFDPKLALVFYHDNIPQFEVDICLDCNFLRSTAEIPATVHHRQDLGGGDSYGLKGFSEYSRKKIIELGKELAFDYGELGPEEHQPPFPKE